MKKLRDEIYQEMHGFKVLERDYTPKGKSKWYYLDPRFDGEDNPQGQIDVANENSPNPRLNEILANDMQENPENYYIWRTCKDDKVRGKHAEREGKVFNRHIPPEGGNPGEDYNCRCWAEPYDAKKYKNKPMIIDVSGLDMFKELKPIDFTTKGLPQYAANNKANIASDAMDDSSYEYAHRKVKFRSPEEEKLLRHMADVVAKSENIIEYPYLDSKGLITTGKGNNINRWELFKEIHWEIDGRPATEQEIKRAYDNLVAKRLQLQKEYDELMEFKRLYPQKYASLPESQKKEKGPFNYGANYYAQFTDIKISQKEIDYHTFTHLKNDYDVLKKTFTNFDTQPMGFKEVAFDIQYNVIGGINSFGKFIDAYKSFMQTHSRTYFNEMLKQSHRIGVSDTRNRKAIQKLVNAYGHMIN